MFRGREGFAEMIATVADTWGKYRFEPQLFLHAGDHVVVFLRILAEGGASGVPVEFETTQVWTVRGGRATSMHRIGIVRKPSKPPDCGSRRCRGERRDEVRAAVKAWNRGDLDAAL